MLDSRCVDKNEVWLELNLVNVILGKNFRKPRTDFSWTLD